MILYILVRIIAEVRVILYIYVRIHFLYLSYLEITFQPLKECRACEHVRCQDNGKEDNPGVVLRETSAQAHHRRLIFPTAGGCCVRSPPCFTSGTAQARRPRRNTEMQDEQFKEYFLFNVYRQTRFIND